MSLLSFLEPTTPQEASQYLADINLQDNSEGTRAKILSCWDSVDVTACPGSGKTSMLVANLGWAIDRWTLDGAGICVLSHTNVAKDEIEKRLSKKQRSALFSYPNFVGTIHEFSNKYFAVPALRSMGNKIRAIDNDIHDHFARLLLKSKRHETPEITKARVWNQMNSQRNVISNLRRIDGELVFQSNGGRYDQLPMGPATDSYQGFDCIKSLLNEEGYFCHDEMLSLAIQFQRKNRSLPLYIRQRFPLVLIDEAQDTNELQSSLLHSLFDPNEIVVQRFGDLDQQIFDFGERAETDHFSVRSRNELSLSETHRCNQSISSAASQLSVCNLSIRSVANESQILPQIVLFDKDSVSRVIPKFLNMLETCDVPLDESSTVKIVGQIGKKPDAKQEQKFPYSIWHYVSSFTKPNRTGAAQPRNLGELVFQCREQFWKDCENYYALNTFSAGLMRLLPNLGTRHTSRFPFRDVRAALENGLDNQGDNTELLEALLDLFTMVTQSQLTESELKLKTELILNEAGVQAYSKDFLTSVIKPIPKSQSFAVRTHDSGVLLPVELNTIAGVKGETHTATLVLETFSRSYCIQDAIEAAFKQNPSESQKKRMRHLYVAMTRPTDFLCLALPSAGYNRLVENSDIRDWLDNHFEAPVTV